VGDLLDGGGSVLAGADADHVTHLQHEDLAVTDLPVCAIPLDRVDHGLDLRIVDDHLDLGLFGVDMVNVLEVNLELRKRYGEPGTPAT
jgi:hypothetical protein